jgi:hypothetical protein
LKPTASRRHLANLAEAAIQNRNGLGDIETYPAHIAAWFDFGAAWSPERALAALAVIQAAREMQQVSGVYCRALAAWEKLP